MPVEPHDELHIFADRIVAVAADPDHGVFMEEPEGAGNDEHRVDRRPAEPAEQEGAQVFDDLKQREDIGRESHLR